MARPCNTFQVKKGGGPKKTDNVRFFEGIITSGILLSSRNLYYLDQETLEINIPYLFPIYFVGLIYGLFFPKLLFINTNITDCILNVFVVVENVNANKIPFRSNIKYLYILKPDIVKQYRYLAS